MPSPPNIDGLPIWLQVFVTLAFGLATILVAVKGYFRKEPPPAAAILADGRDGQVQQVASSVIADMGAVRHLADVCIHLTGQIESLENAIREQTHWTRNKYELDREVCARLRELREEIARKG